MSNPILFLQWGVKLSNGNIIRQFSDNKEVLFKDININDVEEIWFETFTDNPLKVVLKKQNDKRLQPPKRHNFIVLFGENVGKSYCYAYNLGYENGEQIYIFPYDNNIVVTNDNLYHEKWYIAKRREGGYFV